jgi:hypothetical protein
VNFKFYRFVSTVSRPPIYLFHSRNISSGSIYWHRDALRGTGLSRGTALVIPNGFGNSYGNGLPSAPSGRPGGSTAPSLGTSHKLEWPKRNHSARLAAWGTFPQA